MFFYIARSRVVRLERPPGGRSMQNVIFFESDTQHKKALLFLFFASWLVTAKWNEDGRLCARIRKGFVA